MVQAVVVCWGRGHLHGVLAERVLVGKEVAWGRQALRGVITAFRAE